MVNNKIRSGRGGGRLEFDVFCEEMVVVWFLLLICEVVSLVVKDFVRFERNNLIILFLFKKRYLKKILFEIFLFLNVVN